MPATVKLRLGNLLDGPADMIVLPCSTGGTVTGFVARSLSKYSIPHPRVDMPLGDVEILPFEGGENIAQHVAFATSVKAMTSSLEAIESIGVKIGRLHKQKFFGAGCRGAASWRWSRRPSE